MDRFACTFFEIHPFVYVPPPQNGFFFVCFSPLTKECCCGLLLFLTRMLPPLDISCIYFLKCLFVYLTDKLHLRLGKVHVSGYKLHLSGVWFQEARMKMSPVLKPWNLYQLQGRAQEYVKNKRYISICAHAPHLSGTSR